ncbi:DUF4131 domain-containing protein, partial [Klebsiella pneumoniae]|nr:DUF4131 domain-containing protein [Klebsiella pneumoniae]
PVITEKSQKIIFKTSTKAKIITFAPLYPLFSYGDKIKIQGALSRPQAFETNSGKTFNYGAYLAKDDIFWKLDTPTLTLLSHDNGSPIKSFF